MSPLYSGAEYVCRCLQVTETDLLEAVESDQVHSLCDVIRQTGAGEGCTACHRKIREYLRECKKLAVAH